MTKTGNFDDKFYGSFVYSIKGTYFPFLPLANLKFVWPQPFPFKIKKENNVF